MNLKILSWNVRGLNKKDKRTMVNSLIHKWKADVYCFQETKLEGEVAEIVKQIWPNWLVRFGCFEVSGMREGIIIMWDSRVWK